MKRQLQKWHYLSEFLRLSEILNFFVERSSTGPFEFGHIGQSAGQIGQIGRFGWNFIFVLCQNFQNAQKVRFLKMAGNAIGQIIFFSKCSPNPGEHLRYPQCYHRYHRSLYTKQKSDLEKFFFEKKYFFQKKIFSRSLFCFV